MYKLTNSTGSVILRLADGASIPADPGNGDYSEYLQWCQENTPEPYTPPPHPVPQSVSRARALIALHRAGLLEAVQANLAQAPIEGQIAWQHAQEFSRNSPTVLGAAAALGLTSEQLDALFIAAEQIVL